MLIAVASLLLASSLAVQADVTGKWDGTIKSTRSDGTESEDTVLMILEQKDATVTGTVGGNDSDQHKITSGSVEGSTLKLVAVSESGREYRVELKIEGDEMTGIVTSGDRRADLRVRRRKP